MSLPFSRAFMLTIPRSLESRAKDTLAHLDSVGIKAEQFIGMDGEESGVVTTHTYEVDHPGSGYRISNTTTAMCISHLMMWKVCQYLEGDSFLFLEDDVRFDSKWRDHFDSAIKALPDDWDLLYLGSCCCNGRNPQPILGRLHKVTFALCTHAYAVRKKALPVLEWALSKIYTNIDIGICLHAIPSLNTYAFLPRLAVQSHTETAP